MLEQAAEGVGVPIAIQRPETSASQRLRVELPHVDGVIPRRYSEYYDGVSPRITWSAVKGAQSYVVIMEDPDAKPITPFVHWLAWNIPGNYRHLPEGLQEQERLTDPEGVHQGRTSRGTVGYLGPRPPVGDPPHHYHFQVFALDTCCACRRAPSVTSCSPRCPGTCSRRAKWSAPIASWSRRSNSLTNAARDQHDRAQGLRAISTIALSVEMTSTARRELPRSSARAIGGATRKPTTYPGTSHSPSQVSCHPKRPAKCRHTSILQPLTGFYLMHLANLPFDGGWVVWSIVLYLVAGAAWLPVVWIQIRMREQAVQAAATGVPLPDQYWRLLRVWVALGIVAFTALVIVFYLMVAKPF